jgi:hypothetical protein
MVARMATSAAISKAELLAAPLLLALTLACGAAFADAAKEPARIFVAYRAPPTCPDRAAFIQRLVRRIGAASLTEDSRLGQTVTVTVEPDGAQILGRMEADDGIGRPVMRTVRAMHCEEVVSAMAFVTALAIEASAGDASVSGTSPQAEQTAVAADGGFHGKGDDSERQSDASVSGTSPQAEQTAAVADGELHGKGDGSERQGKSSARSGQESGREQHRSYAASPGTSVELGATSPASRSQYSHELGLRVGIVQGLVGPGAAMGAGIEWGSGPRPLLPLFRFAATWEDNQRTLPPNQLQGTAHFRLLAGEAQLCSGVVLLRPTLLTAGLCSGIELGQYLAEGKSDSVGQTKGRSQPMFFAAVATAFHVRLESDRLFLDFSPSIRLPLVRREFDTLNTSAHVAQSVYHIPSIAFGATCSAGVSFR